ncbi:hypothetical protein ABPG72_005907 [Tetrahymena utriculariae]
MDQNNQLINQDYFQMLNDEHTNDFEQIDEVSRVNQQNSQNFNQQGNNQYPNNLYFLKIQNNLLVNNQQHQYCSQIALELANQINSVYWFGKKSCPTLHLSRQLIYQINQIYRQREYTVNYILIIKRKRKDNIIIDKYIGNSKSKSS